MAYPSSSSGQSIISLSTTVPSSHSGQSVVSLGSSTSSSHYETCPSDSPPRHRRWPSDPQPPLPRPPTFHLGEQSLEGAFSGLAVGANEAGPNRSRAGGAEESLSSHPQSERSNKPLPRLPPHQPDHTAARERQDPGSARYRAGSSFTTVYDPRVVPSRGGQTSSAHAGREGAVDLVLRRRDKEARASGGHEAGQAGSTTGTQEQRTSWTGHAPSHAPYSNHPSSSNNGYGSPPPPRTTPDRYLVPTYPNYQQTQPPYYASQHAAPLSAPAHPAHPRPLHDLQQAVPFPTHHSPYRSPSSDARLPLPPPPLPYRPYTSPPALSSTSTSPSIRTPTKPREPSFSLLPPISSPSPSKPHPRPSPSHQHYPPPSPSTPRPRAQSANPATPSSASKAGDTRLQCSGRNKSDGKRCQKRRGVKHGGSPSPTKRAFGGEEGEEEEWYCHLHEKAILEQNEGAYLGRAGWIEFSDWIPPELLATSPSTTIQLMKLMARPPTSASSTMEKGFIYCFEYRSLGTKDYRTFKIGSSKNPHLRLDQWSAQCPSHVPTLLGVVPGGGEVGLRGVGGDEEGTGVGGVQGSLWLEKLVQTEIQSLDPGTRTRVLCSDCSKFHQELFRVPRVGTGDRGDEWEDIVRPVMERWGRFVEMILGD